MVRAVSVPDELSPATTMLSPGFRSDSEPGTASVTVVLDDVRTTTLEVAPDRSVTWTVRSPPSTFVTVPRVPPRPAPFEPPAPLCELAPWSAATLADELLPEFRTNTATPPISRLATPAIAHERQPVRLGAASGGLPATGGRSGSGAR